MDWSTKQTLDFIRAYESHPVLWDPQNPDNKNRTKLNEAWLEIQSRFKAKPSVIDLKRKKESLMSSYRVLRKKIAESIKNGRNIYQPSWFAYEALDRFIRASRKKKPVCISEGEIDDSTSEYSSPVQRPDSPKQTPPPPPLPPRKAVKHKLTDEENETPPIATTMAKSDEAEILAKIWASEYRELRPDQKLFAKKAINDVLFEARLGTLTRYSVTINESHMQGPSSSYYGPCNDLDDSPVCSMMVDEHDFKQSPSSFPDG